MAIKSSIFEVDRSESGSKSDDLVARFRSGFQTPSGRPVGLDHFRVTTGDPDVAARVIELLGDDGQGVSEWETSTEEKLQVFTTTDSVEVIIEPGAVRSTLVLWSRAGKKIVETDGEFLIEEGKLTDRPWDGASKTLAQIKQDAKDGVGPGPSLQVYFRLVGAPDLGKFAYYSQAWTAVESFGKAETELEEIGGPARAVLFLERVEFTAKDGTNVSYVKPQIEVTGPFEGEL